MLDQPCGGGPGTGRLQQLNHGTALPGSRLGISKLSTGESREQVLAQKASGSKVAPRNSWDNVSPSWDGNCCDLLVLCSGEPDGPRCA